METRYCIEYVNPLHPFRDDGGINVRYDRVLTLEQAEDDLTLILSFGGKILDLYMGNVVDGETGEWNPKPIIISDDDWVTPKWLNSLKNEKTNEEKDKQHEQSLIDLNCKLEEQQANYEELKKRYDEAVEREKIATKIINELRERK